MNGLAAPRDARRHGRRWWPAALLAVVALAAGLVFYDTTVADTDLWWHLAYGRYCAEHATLRVDHTAFAWTDTSAAWVYVSWLGDLTLYAVHRAGGTGALRVLQCCLYAAVIVLAWRARRVRGPAAVAASVLAILLAFLVAKPMAVFVKNTMFSATFAAVVMASYLAARRGRGRWLWCLPPLFLVWVNSHGEATLGIALLALLTGGELALGWLGRPSALGRAGRRRLVAVAMISLAALLCTPEGWRLPAYWLQTLAAGARVGHGAVRDTIPALAYLWPERLQEWPRVATVWLWLGMTAALATAIVQGIRTRRWPDLPLALAAVAFTLGSWFVGRLILLAPVVWLFAMAPVLDRWRWTRRPAAIRGLTGAVAALALAILGAKATLFYESDWGVDRLEASRPAAAARFVREHDLPGPLFNDYRSGGALIWDLGGYRPVFIDPRYTPYPPRFMAAYVQFQRQPTLDGLRELERRHGFRTAVLANVEGRRMAAVFQQAPGWRLVFLGPTASVFVHEDAMTPALARAAADPTGGEAFAGLTNLRQFNGLLNVAAAASPALTMKIYRRFEANVPGSKLLKRRTADELGRYFEARAFAAGDRADRRLTADQVKQRFAMYYLDGDLDVAGLVARGYLRVHPEDATMHYNLACVEARAGALDLAAAALERALRLGYARFEQIAADPDLAPLRSCPRFASLVDHYRRGDAAAVPRPPAQARTAG